MEDEFAPVNISTPVNFSENVEGFALLSQPSNAPAMPGAKCSWVPSVPSMLSPHKYIQDEDDILFTTIRSSNADTMALVADQ